MKKMLILGSAIVLLVGCNKVQVVESEPVVITMPVETLEAVEIAQTVSIPEEVDSEPEPEIEVVDDFEPVVYRVTAYCPCEVCCGDWAKNRPVDEAGNQIVKGAWGIELTDGFSCASPMAFGTQVELDGIGTVEVQDRTAKWVVERHGNNIIDIYMTDHDAANEFGVKYIEGVIK